MTIFNRLDPATKTLILEHAKAAGIRILEEFIDGLSQLTKAAIKARFTTH